MIYEYRCFHCKQVFTDEYLAREHFGESPVDFPTCILDRQHGCFGGPHDPYTPVRKDYLADIEAKVLRYGDALKRLRRYEAVQGRCDSSDDKDLVGLALGSQWGPCYDPKYEPYELAEDIATWLKKQCNEALGEAA